MSEDLTNTSPPTDSEMLNLILINVQNLHGRIENLEIRFEKLETRFEKLETRFEKLEIRVGNIDSRLSQLEQKVEEKLHDTRPIWHRVVADIGQLQTSHQRLHNGQQSLETSVQRLEEGQQYLRTLILELNGSMRGVNHDLRGIENRLHRLEADR